MNSSKLIAAKRIFAKYKAAFAYLFGSRVKNNLKHYSDFDFAVYLNEKKPEKRFEIRLKLLNELQKLFTPIGVDTVVLNDIHSITLAYSVFMEGKLIYEKNADARLDYELRIMREYEDFEPFLKKYNKIVLKVAI